MNRLNLNFDLKFDDLYSYKGILKLDILFVQYLKNIDINIHNQLVYLRKHKPDKIEYSKFLIQAAPKLEEFISELFNIENAVLDLRKTHLSLDNIYICKRLFVQRRALKIYDTEKIKYIEINSIIDKLSMIIGNLDEHNFANNVIKWINEDNQNNLDLAMKFAAWASLATDKHNIYQDWVLFDHPKKTDFANLIAFDTEIIDGITIIKSIKQKNRLDFNLTDPGANLTQALDQSNYCIYCHNQNKDSCSTGIKTKEGNWQINSLNVTLTGCPLEQKISEMNKLKSEGFSIGALAAAIVDNPMIAATGHRICNDCMKSCIYQKQDPVNIPKIETRVLKDVLYLPWGFEIYSLLTRWNPLNLYNPLLKQHTNKKILVAGLGPAGFTVSHYLLNEGHIVVAVDGLKIEPIDPFLSGVNIDGSKTEFKPIYDIKSIYEDLNKRTQAGFGGVAEYGITVRWDKNYLKIIRILLERRENFSMIGGVRFGSQITTQSAFSLGFDHICLALGAGSPNILNLPNSMIRGIRAASDFLMSLQLGGAAKGDSISNLQLRLPVLVVGGGLTATDAATEALVYYPIQVEKFLTTYENNVKLYGTELTEAKWSEEDRFIAEEFILHAQIFRLEKAKVKPNLISIIKRLGGVKIAYRGDINNSPSYRFNAEELNHALVEGVEFISNFSIKSIEQDKYEHIKSIIDNNNNIIKVKTILYAIGTKPNITLADEESDLYTINGDNFQIIDENNNQIVVEKNIKSQNPQIITLKYQDKYTSFIGDLHPSYSGNVVKAMKSAKDAYKIISRLVEPLETSKNDNFISDINKNLRAKIHKINRLSDNIIELIIKAPFAAKMFKPGQFYKLQNFEYNAKKIYDTRLSIENLALTGAIIYKEQNLISLIVLEMGGSSDLCKTLNIGEYISLMGPTGGATEIDEGKTIVLAGGGLGNAVLISIGKALRAAGSKVLYFAGYRKLNDIYKKEELEQSADIIIWCCEEGNLENIRQSDRSFKGNIVEAMDAYAMGYIINGDIKFTDIDKIIAIGSDKMMEAVNIARNHQLKMFLTKNPKSIASINSPMQCMMGAICAQCIQQHIDPDTALASYVYSCINQDQDMNKVDFSHLTQRLKQNSALEKNTALWLKHCLNS